MAKLAAEIAWITLIEDDLDEAKSFYARVFGLEPLFEDQDSVLLSFGGMFVNLLKRPVARERPYTAPVTDRQAGVRGQLTIFVDDVDDRCAQLGRVGVALLNGPMNRPWGMRTAAFKDPSGHIWEIAQDL